MKNIVILGSTGSIGTQALDSINESKDRFRVLGLSCNSGVETLINQVELYNPKFVTVYDIKKYSALKRALAHTNVKVLSGMSGLIEMVTDSEVDIVLTSVVGNIGLIPTLEAIKAGKTIALANKETLVTSGSLIMPLARQMNVPILPVDSEHSAIFQSLQGESQAKIKRILLTASGGAFRNFDKETIKNKKAVEALKHPNWSMGKKITIDSATLMNKGLELIEAHWLFDVPPSQIEVVVHPESIIHSMVEFKDHSIIAQMGVADMRVPIIYALDYPERHENSVESLDFSKLKSLSFGQPDLDRFPCLEIAINACQVGGTVPTVMNAANEVLVAAYLNDKIGFYDISEIIQESIQNFETILSPSLEDILAVDHETRLWVEDRIRHRK
ncbi:1-deoxy-D-xylulose-5-phosphate reductoisomerase [Fusibacter tunisiensis]|uniref:1-deoxy-D-xylulose 5-phosphate reductoisomerase n=1 Tax=Fusibacter tunisiensis TaxID=1008308 RepID=A0ABS2MMJ8_9FIRM|nr:1-deoxy-D-xylulose-5-phosphate reductoisomerase [Fusibacter tunisiensis]MBM7560621.1 1-deoxy-D-xylulose-5-phosphate reductoisomerase [Fusibacter tunisiensis]